MALKKELLKLGSFFQIFKEAFSEKSSISQKIQILFMLLLMAAMIVFFFYYLPSTIFFFASYIANFVGANLTFIIMLIFVLLVLGYLYFCIIWLPEKGYEKVVFFLDVPGGAIFFGALLVVILGMV